MIDDMHAMNLNDWWHAHHGFQWFMILDEMMICTPWVEVIKMIDEIHMIS